MLDGIEALIALEKFGTVSEAATRLRLTQSAVSKRIHALQHTVGYKLVEPHGRRVRLTAPGLRLLERARPLVAELRALAGPAEGGAVASLSMVLGDSIAASWGPAVIRRALSEVRQRGLIVTDDTAACELIGQPVQLVRGSSPNPKVTVPSDLPYVELLLRAMG